MLGFFSVESRSNKIMRPQLWVPRAFTRHLAVAHRWRDEFIRWRIIHDWVNCVPKENFDENFANLWSSSAAAVPDHGNLALQSYFSSRSSLARQLALAQLPKSLSRWNQADGLWEERQANFYARTRRRARLISGLSSKWNSRLGIAQRSFLKLSLKLARDRKIKNFLEHCLSM